MKNFGQALKGETQLSASAENDRNALRRAHLLKHRKKLKNDERIFRQCLKFFSAKKDFSAIPSVDSSQILKN